MTNQFNHPRSASRPGFTLIELAAAAGLLGTVFLVTLPLIKRVRTSREASHQQLIAQQEAANIMERVAINPTSETLEEGVEISPEAASSLSDASVTITRQPAEDGLQQVTITLSWVDETGEPVLPVQLTAWFPAQGESP